MTDADLETRVGELLEELRAHRAVVTPQSVNPDGTPGPVAGGELITSAWGNAVATTIDTLMMGPQSWYLQTPAGTLAPNPPTAWGLGAITVPATMARAGMIVTAEYVAQTPGQRPDCSLQAGIDGVAYGTMSRGQVPANGYLNLVAFAVGAIAPGSHTVHAFVSGVTANALAGPLTAIIFALRNPP